MFNFFKRKSKNSERISFFEGNKYLFSVVICGACPNWHVVRENKKGHKDIVILDTLKTKDEAIESFEKIIKRQGRKK